MADQKISQLTAASTPLAGTEVFPIVQSSTTVKATIGNVQTAPYSAGTANGVTYLNGSKVLTSGTAITFDGTNLGVGVTLNAWGSGQTAFQTPAGAIWNFNTANMTITQNVFSDGTEKYINTGFASAYNQNSGQHVWSSAPSGTGGTAVTRTTTMTLAASGIVTMSAYGAGAATFSAAGVISSVSDETWKVKDGVPVDTDSMLKKLEPGYWYYNDEKKEIFGIDRQLGFYAQNVNAAIGPEAAPIPEEGKPWGYYDRSVLAVTVMSLQKALATIESLTARIAALEAKIPA